MSLDLAPALYAAVASNVGVASQLGIYNGEPAIFTRRPIPEASTYPLVAISPDVTIGDEDGTNYDSPTVVRDVTVYGLGEVQYRAVETLAYLLRTQFHRQRDSITVTGWNVVSIIASGPRSAPTDDDQTIGRVITLTIKLAS